MPVQVNHLSEHVLIDKVAEAVARLNARGFVCPVVTVQSRIAKGTFSANEFGDWFADFQLRLRQMGAVIRGPYVCPHRFEEPCQCKKPSPYLYQLAAAELGIDISRSVVIGDTTPDVLAAKGLGFPGCLVRTGWGESSIIRDRADKIATHVAGNILEAANWAVDL
jgi:histidinol-phosphate phosphatase family protein